MPTSAAGQEPIADQEYRCYIIQIKEKLPPGWSEWFEGLSVDYTAAGETILTGPIPDQAALHGLLARIRDLNLTLISVHQISCTPGRQEHIKGK